MADDLPDDTDPPPQSDGARLSPRNGTVDGCTDEHGDEALAQARHVFLRGCGLLDEAGALSAWRGGACWSVLDGDLGLGLKFLATWHAWRKQADRLARLFYTAVTACPGDPQDLVVNAKPFPELVPLAAQLAAQWHGLLPGVHRLRLDGGRVQLTLAVGDIQPMLAELTGDYDSLFLDGSDPDIWRPHTLKAVARLARPGARVAARRVPTEARERLVVTPHTETRSTHMGKIDAGPLDDVMIRAAYGRIRHHTVLNAASFTSRRTTDQTLFSGIGS